MENLTPLTLDDIGRLFGTDKASGQHDYLSFYETFLSPMREEAIKLLEIGVAFGCSLRLWEAYFSKATIVGADIHPGVKSFNGDRFRLEIIDQSNIEDLVRLGVKHGPFDLIVDDGSHRWDHQIVTLKTLFPFVKEDGLYIVEDLQTNFGESAVLYRGTSSISCVEYLKKLIDLRVADEESDILNQEDAFFRTYARQISSVTFFRHACVIKKRYRANQFNPSWVGSPATDAATASIIPTEIEGKKIQVSIIAHMANEGDRRSATGAIRVLDDVHGIQGFIIAISGTTLFEIEYRARLSGGNWTKWVGCGEFVGTMGIHQSLTGFSARLTTKDAANWKLKMGGMFRGLADPVFVNDTEDCESTSGNMLYGMEISVIRR